MRIRPSPLLALVLCSCATLAPLPEPPAQPDAGGETTPKVPDAAQAAEETAPPTPELEPPPVASEPVELDQTELWERQVRLAIDAHDWARARALIDDILTTPKVAEARVLLDAGRSDEALAVTRVAVAVAPSEPRVLLVHAEAMLRVGQNGSAREMLEDALQFFLRAGTTSEAWLGASRAARALGRDEAAAEHARQARRELTVRGPTSVRYPELPELTIATALWQALAARANDAEHASEVRDSAGECADALRALLALEPHHAWAWTGLARSLQWLDAREEALAALASGFAALPDETSLRTGLENAARELGGAQRVITEFERARARAPRTASVWWIPARERFEAALARLSETPVDEFRVAERDFAAARECDPTLTAECMRYESLCRSATGWCRLSANDLGAAAESFRAMKQLGLGAILNEMPPRLGSGVAGLAAVAEAHASRGELWLAAQIGEELRKLLPDSLERAAFAGRLHREAGEQSRQFATEYQLAAERKITDPRRINSMRERARIDPSIPSGSELDDTFASKSAAQTRRAQQCFERSYVAYVAAWRLRPDDVRAAVDAAFVPIVYLAIDLDFARDRLKNAIVAGDRQLQSTQLSDAARIKLQQAFGDAHELLGVYYLEHARQPEDAVRHFEKSLAIGPLPRPSVEQNYLPRCRKLLAR